MSDLYFRPLFLKVLVRLCAILMLSGILECFTDAVIQHHISSETVICGKDIQDI